jgi:magnesium transporter
VPVVPPSATIKEIKSLVSHQTRDYESINYIYVVNAHKKLEGILSIKELFGSDDSALAKNVMVTELVYAHPYTNRERAAHMALKHNIKAIPVLDKENNFMGVLTGDQILTIMHEESVEDLLKIAGVGQSSLTTDNVMTMSIWQSLKHRLPWIIIGLAGGIAIAETIGFFEQTLSQNLILAAFIPLMVYMSNAVGQQVNVFVIRDTAINGNLPFWKYFSRQLWIVFLISILMGILLYTYTRITHSDIVIANIMGIAIFATILSSVFSGFFIPFIFIKLKSDPANASGPISTVIQDFLSVLIYFAIATALLQL